MLSKSKLKFRQALYLFARCYQFGMELDVLNQYHIDDDVIDELVALDLIEMSDDGYRLSDLGLNQVQKVFKYQPQRYASLDSHINGYDDGFIFVADLQNQGHELSVKYLADESGLLTEDIDKAYFCPASQYKLQKKLLRELSDLNLEPSAHSQIVLSNGDSSVGETSKNSPDYSDWLN